MEIKPSRNDSSSNHKDYDKCVLATSAIALALSSVSDRAEIRSLAIPFIVVEGGFLSLYVTRLNENGVPFVSLVNLHEDIYQSDRLNCLSSPSDARLRSFVALAVLLDESCKTAI